MKSRSLILANVPSMRRPVTREINFGEGGKRELSYSKMHENTVMETCSVARER